MNNDPDVAVEEAQQALREGRLPSAQFAQSTFTLFFQPKWLPVLEHNISKLVLETNKGQCLAELFADLGNPELGNRRIRVHVTRQPVSIALALPTRDPLVSEVTCRHSEWIPSYDGILYSQDGESAEYGVLTHYTTIEWAAVSVIGALAVQYQHMLLRLESELFSSLTETDAVAFEGKIPERMLQRVNEAIDDHEYASRLGLFLKAWQGLEEGVRILLLRVRSAQQNASVIDIYSPDKSSLSSRAEAALKVLDPQLLKEIQTLVQNRNRVIHGCRLWTGKSKDKTKQVIAHHDFSASIWAQQPQRKGHIGGPMAAVTPDSKYITMENLSHLTRFASEATARLMSLTNSPDLMFKLRASKPKKVNKRRRKRRRRRGSGSS